MDGLWQTSWYEDLLFTGVFFLGIFSVLLLIYAMCVTVKAMLGQYAKGGVILYWIYFSVSLLLAVSSFGFWGILFFIGFSPFMAFVMRRIERIRIQKLNDDGLRN